MNTYDIYYSLKPEFHNPPERRVVELGRTHAFVTMIDAEDLNDAYRQMQAHVWQPNASDIAYLRWLSVHHASMSIDDVLWCQDTNTWYQVVDVGFREIF